MPETPYLLMVKTSSLGDVIHALPALEDARRVWPDLQCDWVVEAPFADIPSWHPSVKRIIPVSLRQWRRSPWQAWRSGAWHRFKQALQQNTYTHIVDLQGLIKSAWMASMARGPRHGLDRHGAREPLASRTYHHVHAISPHSHAVEKNRKLMAQALGYAWDNSHLAYGLQTERLHWPHALNHLPQNKPWLMFLHGTTWATKQWPEQHWHALVQRAAQEGHHVLLPWGSPAEHQAAERLAHTAPAHTCVLPALDLSHLGGVLARVRGVFAVDTGLGHLAAALGRPTVSVYGATQAERTGTQGLHQAWLRSAKGCSPCLQQQCRWHAQVPPCYDALDATRMWSRMEQLWNTASPL